MYEYSQSATFCKSQPNFCRPDKKAVTKSYHEAILKKSKKKEVIAVPANDAGRMGDGRIILFCACPSLLSIWRDNSDRSATGSFGAVLNQLMRTQLRIAALFRVVVCSK